MSASLVRYEQARIALSECARIDEAAEIRDKAAAMAAYARQREDRDLAVWVSEIQLRASVRIGELSRELDTGKPTHGWSSTSHGWEVEVRGPGRSWH